MTDERRQYLTGAILLIMVAVAAFLIGINYQNNKGQIKNRMATLLGQPRQQVQDDSDSPEEVMVERKKMAIMHQQYCRQLKRLEQRVQRLEQMQTMPMMPTFDSYQPQEQYEDYSYGSGVQSQPAMPMEPQYGGEGVQRIEFSPNYQQPKNQLYIQDY